MFWSFVEGETKPSTKYMDFSSEKQKLDYLHGGMYGSQVRSTNHFNGLREWLCEFAQFLLRLWARIIFSFKSTSEKIIDMYVGM